MMNKKLGKLIYFLAVLFLGITISCEKDSQDIQLTPIQILEKEFSFDQFENSVEIEKDELLIDWSSYTTNKIGGDLFYEFLIEKKYFSQSSVHGYTSSVYRLVARFITNDEPEFYIVELLPSVDSEHINLFYTSVEDFSGMAYVYNSKGQKVSIESYENGVLQTKRLDGSFRDLIARIPQKCDVLEGLEPTNNCGGGGGCTTSSVVVQRWTYWYDVEVDTQTGVIVSATYSHRQYRGSYVKQITRCGGSAGGQGSNVDRTIIPVSQNGEELQAAFAPTYHFPVDLEAEYREKYKKLVELVEGKIKCFLKDDHFVNTLSKYSYYSPEQLHDIFENNNSTPSLQVVSGILGDGEFPAMTGLEIEGLDYDDNTILLNSQAVTDFENGSHDYTTVEGMLNLLSMTLIIAHETTHHGDYHLNNSQGANSGNETGQMFEDEYTGEYRLGDQYESPFMSGLYLYVKDNINSFKRNCN